MKNLQNFTGSGFDFGLTEIGPAFQYNLWSFWCGIFCWSFPDDHSRVVLHAATNM